MEDGIPIVTLDKIYITPDNKQIYYLDCTRVEGTNKIVSRCSKTLDFQFLNLSKQLNCSEIFFADDVVFSGQVLNEIIKRFNQFGIKVVGIISAICTEKSYNYFQNILKWGIKTNYIMSNEVIDQICERDFYFGIAGSGIMVETKKGLYKSPYFKPYGDPENRASIPSEYVRYFSKGCLNRSSYLWEEIDKKRGTRTKMEELPERIVNTSEKDEVVKTLKKEIKRL